MFYVYKNEKKMATVNAPNICNRMHDTCDHFLIHLLKLAIYNMSAEECPPEIWAIIFPLTCRDDRNTTLALSQVSWSINAYSKPY